MNYATSKMCHSAHTPTPNTFRRCTLSFAITALFALPSLTFAAEGIADAGLKRNDFLDQATAASHSDHGIHALPDGRVQMRVPMQALEAKIGHSQTEIQSTGSAGHSAFAWQVGGLGRGEHVAAVQRGKLNRQTNHVLVQRPAFTEKYSATSNGLNQQIAINTRPSGEGELALYFAADDLQLHGLTTTQKAVSLEMADGRLLHYHDVIVTDAQGKSLPARLQLMDSKTLRLAINDAKATYPISVAATFSDADWAPITGSDFNQKVLAAAYGNNTLFVGGSFTLTPSGLISRLAQWNGSTWSAVGDLELQPNSQVDALEWVPDDTLTAKGHLVASVSYQSTTSPAEWHSTLKSWNGSAWTELTSNAQPQRFQGKVHSIESGDGHLFVGGQFKLLSGEASVEAVNIARWDGSTWSDLDYGLNGTVHTLAWASEAQGGRLFAGGDFSAVSLPSGVDSSQHTSAVAEWDGTRWHALDQGLDGKVRTLAWVDDSSATTGGQLYAGGEFNKAGDLTVNHVARWDGQHWNALRTAGDTESGVDGLVTAVAWDKSTSRLLIGGDFDHAGDHDAEYLVAWKDEQWTELNAPAVPTLLISTANDANATHALFAVTNENFNDLEILLPPPGLMGYSVVTLEGATWAPLTSAHPVNGEIHALAWQPNAEGEEGNLYIGGQFTQIGSVAARRVARWDGNLWHPLSRGSLNGVSGTVRALAWGGGANGKLYVGGHIQTAAGLSVNNIAAYQPSSSDNPWQDVAGGTNDAVRALAWVPNAVNPSEGMLYVGGSFTQAGTLAARRVASFSPSQQRWSTLHMGTVNGVSGTVRALAWAPHGNSGDGVLYVGGNISRASTLPVQNIASWNPTNKTWHALGEGVTGTVRALAWGAGNLFIGGNLRRAGQFSINHIARWDSAADKYYGLGQGVNNEVLALAWFEGGDVQGGTLFAGGRFTMAGGQPAAHLAQWNGLNWSSLGSGVKHERHTPFVRALAIGNEGDDAMLFAAGLFDSAGQHSAFNMAEFDLDD